MIVAKKAKAVPKPPEPTEAERLASRIKCLRTMARFTPADWVGDVEKAFRTIEERFLEVRAGIRKDLGTDEESGCARYLVDDVEKLVSAEFAWRCVREVRVVAKSTEGGLVGALREKLEELRGRLIDFSFHARSTCPWRNAQEQAEGKAASLFVQTGQRALCRIEMHEQARRELLSMGVPIEAPVEVPAPGAGP